MATAARYRVWIILAPLAGFAPFLMDGIMIGATMTRILRNSMVCALALYFAIFFSLRGVWGNDALWLAFLLFMVARGVLQYLMAGGIRGIIPRAEEL
jgi:MATE family multidrug resistance protein